MSLRAVVKQVASPGAHPRQLADHDRGAFADRRVTLKTGINKSLDG